MSDYGKQTYGLTEEELIKEENQLSFESFSHKMAEQLFQAIKKSIDEPKDGFKPMGVEIIINNIPVFVHYQYGSTEKTIEWIAGKRKTVEYFGLSSACVDVQANTMGVDKFCEKFGIDSSFMRLCGGSMPIIVRGLGMVGTVTVSGLSRKEDHEIIVKALQEVKHKNAV